MKYVQQAVFAAKGPKTAEALVFSTRARQLADKFGLKRLGAGCACTLL